MAELHWKNSILLILAVFILCSVCSYAQTGVCYQSMSRSTVSYRSRGYSDYYSCGFLWLSRCSRTRYRSTSYTSYYTASVFGCCSGYSVCGSSSCCPICDEPCQNGGICDSPNVCRCTSGWTNTTCESDVNECTDPFLNNCDHLCANTIGSYNCSCNDGYRLSSDGYTCYDIDECTEGTALCADLCHNTNGSFYCSCSETGYQLRSDNITCENIDECVEQTDACAQNCTDTEGSYNCSCIPGYSLANNNYGCNDIDECADNIDNCEQTCENTVGSFNCGCNPGYRLTLNGRTCEDIDECREGIHLCSENCHNSIGSYVCTCAGGFIISANGTTCIDINECIENTNGCAQTCTNTAGSFRCVCDLGYELNSDERTCQDIDECARGVHLCDQLCTNTNGSYTCSCGEGYRMNENDNRCDEIDECEEGTDLCGQVCINAAGSYTCQCNHGYRINSDALTCRDINECVEGTHLCTQNCNNTIGSYVCSCNDGFIIDVDGRTCDDINECSDGIHSCEQVCNNTQGSHHCLCFDGYELDSDGFSCTDLDECATEQDQCDQNCHNSIGSYSCSCNSGFMLTDDRLRCDDINECSTNIHNCIEVCENTYGSYVCTCYTGYVLNSDGNACNDLDECASDQNECDHNCNNTVGSYTCSCNDGYLLDVDRLHCNDIDECALEINNCEQLCVNLNGSYSCECSEGYEVSRSRSYVCKDINECDRSDSMCEQLCTNSNGSFACDCQSGYSQTIDGFSCLGPPVNVTLNTMSSRSLRLSWKLPLGFNERHGTVVHYPIQCNSEENPEHIINVYNPRDMREVELDRLIPYNTYNCCVSVQTTLANSSVVCQAARTPEEAPESSPVGVLLDNRNSNNIFVYWNPPRAHNGIIMWYTLYIGYENGTVDVFYTDGEARSFNITNLYPFQIISIEISASTRIGEGPRTPQIEVQTAQARPSEVNNIIIDAISNTTILVRWDPPTYPNGILTNYSIIVFNEATGFNFTEIHSSDTSEVLVSGLQAFVPYTVQVFASTVAGRGDPITKLLFTGHGVPAVPTLSSVERLSAVSARVNWIPLTPDEARGILTRLEITYEPVRMKDCTIFYPMDSQVVHLTENLFKQSTTDLSDLKPNTEYCVVIKVSTSAGESGFSNSILLPLSRKVPFQVRFPLPDGIDCSMFVVTNSTSKISALTSAISNAVTQQCQCLYNTSFIVNNRLLCSDDKSQVIYQGQLVTTEGKSAEEIRNLTQEWVLTKPFVKIDNKLYQLDSYCSVAVDSEELGEIICDAIAPTESKAADVSSTLTVLELASVIIMAILLIVVLTTCSIIVCLVFRVHNLKQRKSNVNDYRSDLILVGSTHTENLYEVCGNVDDKGFNLGSIDVATTKMNSSEGDCVQHKL